jgi:hypothetical protein
MRKRKKKTQNPTKKRIIIPALEIDETTTTHHIPLDGRSLLFPQIQPHHNPSVKMHPAAKK